MMVYLRRSAAIFLSLVFLVVLVVTVLMTQVMLKALDPSFYNDQLAEANIYEFLLTDVVTAAVEETRRLPPEDFNEQLDENPIVLSGLSTEEIVASVSRMVPPEWLEERTEKVIKQGGGYILGTREEFVLQPRLGKRATIIVDELQQLLLDADAYNFVYQRIVDPFIEESLGQQELLGIQFSTDRITESVRRIIPPNWLADQINQAIDTTTPYFTGQANDFTLKVELGDRVPITQAELKALLADSDVYKVLYDEVVDPQISESLGELITLPEGIMITREEVTTTLRVVAPAEWVQEKVEALIDVAVEYVLGQTDEFAITISLEQNKSDAAAVMEELATQKLDELFASLPQCTVEQTLQIVSDYATTGKSPVVPPCLPQSEIVTPEDLQNAIQMNLTGSVERLILNNIPDMVTFSDEFLREKYAASDSGGRGGQSSNLEGGDEGTNSLDRLDQMRGYLHEGFVYTSDDLKEDLGENISTLEYIRNILSDEWAYTHLDMRRDILDSSGQEALDLLDQVRRNSKLVRSLSWTLYLILALILVAIGFLGGRNWRSRFSWAAAPLALCGLILTVASGPVYTQVEGKYMDDFRKEAMNNFSSSDQFYETQNLVGVKLFDVAVHILDSFMASIRNFGTIILGMGIGIIVAVIFWPHVPTGRPRGPTLH